MGGVCVCPGRDRRPIEVECDAQGHVLGEHQSDLAFDAIVKGSALEVERVQVVGLRKLPSVGLKILGGFAVCLLGAVPAKQL